MFWSQFSDISDEVLEEVLKYSNGKRLQDVILKERISTRFGYLTQGYLSRMKSFNEPYYDYWFASKESQLKVLQRMPRLNRLSCEIIRGWNEDDIKRLAASNQSITRLRDVHSLREFVTYIDTVMQLNPYYVYDGDIFCNYFLEEDRELRDLLDKYPYLNMKLHSSPGEFESKYDHLCNFVHSPMNVKKQYPSVEHVDGGIDEIEDLNLFPNLKKLVLYYVNPRQLIPHIVSSQLQELDLKVETWDPLDNEPLRLMINNYPIMKLTIEVEEDDTDAVYYEYPLIEIILSSPNNQLTQVVFNNFGVYGDTLSIDSYFSERADPVTPEQVRRTLIKFKRIRRISIGMDWIGYGLEIRNVCNEIELHQRRRNLTVTRRGKIINRDDKQEELDCVIS